MPTARSPRRCAAPASATPSGAPSSRPTFRWISPPQRISSWTWPQKSSPRHGTTSRCTTLPAGGSGYDRTRGRGNGTGRGTGRGAQPGSGARPPARPGPRAARATRGRRAGRRPHQPQLQGGQRSRAPSSSGSPPARPTPCRSTATTNTRTPSGRQRAGSVHPSLPTCRTTACWWSGSSRAVTFGDEHFKIPGNVARVAAACPPAACRRAVRQRLQHVRDPAAAT